MTRRLRCAIYTRKSSEEGLKQDFNSLEAQREACLAYVASQKAEGWIPVQTRYDDGGLSGATLQRPALLRLLADIEAGHVDQIVVYKIDRLTRPLSDFAKIVDRLDAAGASFVSVTQSFNTATSMGRLTLNMLLSFAQFEREVTAERIRDKIAASKKKGLWMGGNVPIGYRPQGRTLTIDEKEAVTVRALYDLYLQLGSVRAAREEADRLGLRTAKRISGSGRISGDRPFTAGHLYSILTNPLYAGRIRHRDRVQDGQHPGIIKPELWQQVEDRLIEDSARSRGKGNSSAHSPLAGKLFDETGDRLTPSHTQKNGKRLRYYVSRRLITDRRHSHADAWRLPAGEIEAFLSGVLRDSLIKPAFLTDLIANITASEITNFRDKLHHLAADCEREHGAAEWAPLMRRVDLAQGIVIVRLDRKALTDRLGIDRNRLVAEACQLTAPFRLQRRGIETKIILGATTPRIDPILVKNILTARRWYDAIKAGTTFSKLAERENTTPNRIQQMIGLAFLAPDILDQVVAGTQPVGFTSEWFKRRQLPADWSDQRQAFASL
ncbi:MAG: recombinase family protein [Hyphomicrobiales bacterium]|nr:MAG: recombinase family protein [Hyphomicrobiales bacterium]